MMGLRNRSLERAVVRLAAEHVRDATPTDYGPGFTLHDAFSGIVLDLLDRLDDPSVRERLRALRREEQR